MSLSTNLQRVLDKAKVMMVTDERHELRPFYRNQIYQYLTQERLLNGKAFAVVSIRVAQSVLPIWHKSQPNDFLMERAIVVANRVLAGTIERSEAEEIADKAWQVLEELGTGDYRLEERTWAAGQSIVEALCAVLGRLPFGATELDASTTDNDLDPWCSDAAKWAAYAMAGQPGIHMDVQDLQERQRFWEWWLDEALPVAIASSSA